MAKSKKNSAKKTKPSRDAGFVLPGIRAKGLRDYVIAELRHDSRVAYAAVQGGRRFVMVDGEEQAYEPVYYSKIFFSPGSERHAFVASHGTHVVVDGVEGEHYDAVLTGGGGGVGWGVGALEYVVFDSDDSLHYFARKGDDVFLVREELTFVPKSEIDASAAAQTPTAVSQ